MKEESVFEAKFLNAVLENAGALVVVLDQEGRVRRFNRACEKLSGYTFAEIEGKFPWETFLPAEDAETVRKQAFETLAHSPAARECRYTNYWVSKSGERFLTEWWNTQLLDEDGNVEFVVAVGTDITESRRIEAALRDSEAWLRHAQVVAEVGSWELDLATGSLKWSDETYRIFGIKPGDFDSTYQAFLQKVHPDDRAAVDNAYTGAVRDRSPYQITHRIIWPDGSIRWVQERGETVYDKTGEPLGTFGAVQDITRRRESEDALRINNQILTAVLDTTPVLFAYLDPDMNFVRVNRAYAAADHKEPEYFIGKNHFVLYPNPENEAIFRRVASTGVPHVSAARPFEYPHNPERGVTHWDWTLTPIKDNDGKITGLVLSLLNVTDRIQAMEAVQRSEQDLKALNESLEKRVLERANEAERLALRNESIIKTALDGFFAVDTAGRIRAVNPAFCAMLGYSRDELLQMSIPDIEAIDSPADVAGRIEKLIMHGHDRFDTKHRCKDGKLVDVEMSISFVDLGGEKMFYAFAHDITQRKASEASLVSAREEADRANLAKSEFLSRMSHELRTPMNAILGFGQLLEHENLTPSQRASVGEILQAGRHLLDLINEVLDLSRIEAGRIDLSLEAVELMPLVNECLTMVAPLAAQRRITLESTSDACSRYTLMSDRVRLRQILINLLSNAVKYNNEGGRVFIVCEENQEGGVRLSVRDTGKGIPPEFMHLLFRPFERLQSPYSGIEGTGIGLVLAKRLAESMGGNIGADSQLGVGSTFWVELPAVKAVFGQVS